MKLKNKVMAVLCALLMAFSVTWPGTASQAQTLPVPQWVSAGPDTYLNQVTCLLGMNGQLYKGTSGEGVFVWNGSEWTQVGPYSWPSETGVLCLADIQGTLYAGTEQGGVWTLESGVWTPAGTNWPPEHSVFSLVQVNGTIYAGSFYGVYMINSSGTWLQADTGSTWPLAFGSFPDTATNLLNIDGVLYAETSWNGLYAMSDDGSWYPAGTGWPAGGWSNCLLADGDGTIYAGTGQSGVWALKDGVWARLGSSFVPENGISQLAEVNGTLYAGTGDGIYSWDGTNWTRTAVFTFPTSGMGYSLTAANGTLYCAAGDYVYALNLSGGIWQEVGSYQGLPYFDTVSNSLPLVNVNGTLYAGTGGGVWAFDNSIWSRVHAATWPAYNGIPERACGLFLDTDGTLLAGTSRSGVYALGSNGEWRPVGSGWPAENEAGNGAGYGAWCLASVSGTVYAGTYDWDTSYNGGAGVYALEEGVWTPVGSGTAGYWITGMASDGVSLYASMWEGGISVLDRVSGDWTPVGPDTCPPSLYGVAYMDGTLFGVGYRPDPDLSILWAWDGSSWTAAAQGQSDWTGPRMIYGLNEVDGAWYALTDHGNYAVDLDIDGNVTLAQVGNYDRSVYSIAGVDGTLYTGTDNGVLMALYDVNTAPARRSSVAETAAAAVTVDTAYALDLSTIFEDADADTLTYKVSVNGTNPVATMASYVYTPIAAGITSLAFKANDGTVDSTDTYTVTLTASPAAPATNYTVTFNNNGVIYAAKTVNAGESVGSAAWPADPAEGGYTFGGWFTDQNGAGTRFTSTTPVNATMTVYAKWAYSGGGGGDDEGGTSGGGNGGGGGSSPSAPLTPTYNAGVKEGNGSELTLAVTVDKNAGTASIGADSQGFGQSGTVITIPSIPDIGTYSVGITVPNLSATGQQAMLTLNTGNGSITVPSDMLAGVSGISGSKAEIAIGQGDKDKLPGNVKAALGNKPLITISLSIDGRPVDWSNPNAPVTVSIPYEPTAEELANTESIIIWYIDGSGSVVTIPNGHYNSAAGTVTFETTHFSDYAVAYNKVSFNDAASGAWYNKAVSFIAARDITGGTGNSKFSPDARLTRGEFLVLMMRAYGIEPDTNPTNNFTDAGDTYYTGYLAAAKRLDISTGVGDNRYAPGKEITRQEMFTLLYNALKVINRLPQGGSGKASFAQFTDAGLVAPWATDAMTLLVKTDIVGGSKGTLAPTDTATRAEMAQVLYNLLSK